MHDKSYWDNWLKRVNNYLGLSRGMLDPEWIESQISRGRLHYNYKEVIEKIIPTLEAVYPDRWDIQFETELNFLTSENNIYQPIFFDDYTYKIYTCRYGEEELYDIMTETMDRWVSISEGIYKKIIDDIYYYPTHLFINKVFIVIHFPEITISNSNNQSLEIKDLFVRVLLRSDGSISTYLEGTRSTFNIPEVSSGYIHSHLQSTSWTTTIDKLSSRIFYHRFCLGDSELIDFAHLYNANKIVGNLESYLHMLKTIASWESLEGGPHTRIEYTLIKGDVPYISKDKCIWALLRLKSRIEAEDCNIDWVFRDNRYTIVDNEKFENFLRKLNPMGESDVKVFKDDNGKYFVPSEIKKNSITPRYIDFIPFKGKRFQLKIEGELKFSGDRKWYINPKIKDYVKSKLEYACYEAEVKKYTTEWLNKDYNNNAILKHG